MSSFCQGSVILFENRLKLFPVSHWIQEIIKPLLYNYISNASKLKFKKGSAYYVGRQVVGRCRTHREGANRGHTTKANVLQKIETQ